MTQAVVTVQMEARRQGFSEEQALRLGTAASELARNILKYAQPSCGDLVITIEQHGHAQRLVLQARDNGPGIANLEAALLDHMSTGGTLGLGLPGVRRLMDGFNVRSQAGQGTLVTVFLQRRTA
ncbi:MAG: ATP-binding protein [Vulcanococcus sp.]